MTSLKTSDKSIPGSRFRFYVFEFRLNMELIEAGIPKVSMLLM